MISFRGHSTAPAGGPSPGRRRCHGLSAARRCAVVLAVLACAWPAAAQTPTREKPFPEFTGARNWGPFEVDLQFVIDNIGYDDNVFLVPEVSSTTPEDDIIIRLGPEIFAQSSFSRRTMLTLHDKLEGEVFLDHAGLNHLDNVFDGQFDLLLGPVLLTTQGRWLDQELRPSSEVVDRVNEKEVGLTQIVRLFVGAKTDISADIGRTRYQYQDPNDPPGLYSIQIVEDGEIVVVQVPIGEALDRTETDYAGEIGWRPRSKTRLFYRQRKRVSDFESSIAGRDATERRRLLGLEFRPLARISGRVAAGRAKLEADDPTLELTPYDDTVAQAELAYKPTGATRFTGTWNKDLYFSTFERNLYYVQRQGGLAVATYLGALWGLQGGYTRSVASYPEVSTGLSDAGLAGQKRRDTTDEWYAGLLFRLEGGFEIGIRYGQRNRDSNYLFAVDNQSYFSTSGSYAFGRGR